MASGAKIQLLDSGANHTFLPDLVAVDADILARTTLLYLCSPTNPHGSIMDPDYLKMALSLARQHDFLWSWMNATVISGGINHHPHDRGRRGNRR